MLRKLRAWWYVMANIGPSMGLARQLDDFVPVLCPEGA